MSWSTKLDMQAIDADVWMTHPDLGAIPQTSLPDGYRMRFYAEGDLATWLRIQAHDPFFVPTAETFTTSMPGDTALLSTRVLFLVDPQGEAIGTVTAWSTDRLLEREIGQIHWVALVPGAQGQGLAKPMVAAACVLLRERGYREACLETNTRHIPALNLYLGFGFVPFVRNEAERRAWRAVAPRLRSHLHIPN
jgi:GNAT superfamily N-acetyltransferase